jgi:hypothetical protein
MVFILLLHCCYIVVTLFVYIVVTLLFIILCDVCKIIQAGAEERRHLVQIMVKLTTV